MLDIHSPALKFGLDENGLPTDCFQYERSEANNLVEEFMLLANQAAAQQVAFSLPEQALLRRHEEPIDRRLAGLAERGARLGYELDTSSAGAISKSLEHVDNPAAKNLLVLASQKAVQRAKYFCTGMLDIAKYGHYGLNTPLYAHFTSPIRRYADIIVHRQLESILASNGGDNKFSMDRDSVAKVAQQCNM
jgi:protein SSD1